MATFARPARSVVFVTISDPEHVGTVSPHTKTLGSITGSEGGRDWKRTDAPDTILPAASLTSTMSGCSCASTVSVTLDPPTTVMPGLPLGGPVASPPQLVRKKTRA